MAGMKNFWEFKEDFFGAGTALAADGYLNGMRFEMTTNSTLAYVNGAPSGAVSMAQTSANEAQNACLYIADAGTSTLNMDLRDRLYFECRLKMNQATLDATSIFRVGVGSARADNTDNVAISAYFGLTGANTSIGVECDDATNETAVTNSGRTLGTTYKVLAIDMQNTSDIRFLVDGERVLPNTTFTIGSFNTSTPCVCPQFQIQKTASTAADGVTIDYVYVSGRRAY